MTKTGSTLAFVLILLAGPAFAQDPLTPPPTTLTPTASPGYTAPVVHESGQKETGFVAMVGIGSEVFSLGNVGNNTVTLGVIEGSVFGGFKFGRFIAGLGFNILRVATGRSGTNQQDQSDAQTAILFTPGAQVAILRSSDDRVELFGAFSLGFGHTFTEQNPSPPPGGVERGNFRFRYEIGPGIRFWAAPQFAIGALTGVRGDFEFDSQKQTNGGMTVEANTSNGLTSIFAELQLMGVF